MSKVLVIATSRKTRGGITSVIKAHESGAQWKEFNCEWIETVRDGNPLLKILYFIRAFFLFLIKLPTSKIIHIHSALGTSIIRKNIFITLGKYFNKKVILHFHAAEKSNFENKKLIKIYRRIFDKADVIIALSDSWKNLLIEKLHLDPKKIIVLYNPAPKVNRREVRKPIILFAGTLIKRKGYDTLIRAFSKIANRESAKHWKLVLAGNGEINEANELISRYHLETRIDLPGWISGDQKERLFQESSIFCLPSLAEGFPMAVLDAWAYGIPCILTPVGGIPELVTSEKEGIFIPINDEIKLSEALLKLVESEKIRNAIVQNTDIRIDSDFNIDRINLKLKGIYNQLCSEE